METIIFVASIFFWILFYIFQGIHDVHIIKEIKLLRQNLDEKVNLDLENQIIQKELSWKKWGAFEKALTKLVLAAIIYFATNDIFFAFLLLLLSVALRWFTHDIVVAIGLGKGLKHIGPDFIWTDRFLIKLSKAGINQYVIKISLNLILILIIILHLYI